jgi:hypothetical protein
MSKEVETEHDLNNKPETFLMSKEVDTEHDLNNKPETFLMSKGAEREHNYDQYATGIELNDTSIPQEVHPIDGVKEFKKKIIPFKTQERLENKLQEMQITSKTRRADFPRTQIDTHLNTNYTINKPIDSERNELADKHKHISINHQSKRNEQMITDITSELQNTSQLHPCNITYSLDTGSSITHILDTNNQVNNKQTSQQKVYSHTATTEKMIPNQSKSTDHPLTNFSNGEKSNTSTTFPHGEKTKPPIIFPNGENSNSENQECLKNKPDTYPSTDSIKL